MDHGARSQKNNEEYNTYSYGATFAQLLSFKSQLSMMFVLFLNWLTWPQKLLLIGLNERREADVKRCLGSTLQLLVRLTWKSCFCKPSATLRCWLPFPSIEPFFPVFRATCCTLSPAKQGVQLKTEYNSCCQPWPRLSWWSSQSSDLGQQSQQGLGWAGRRAEGLALFHKVFVSVSIVDQ